jgi:SPP1 family predicted phage head-tail adaptor
LDKALQIDAGQLRHRVSLQYNTGTAGALNEIIPNWTTRNQVWAMIEPLSAREYIANQEVRGEVSHKIAIRYDPTISNTDRIQDENEVNYTITGILNIQERNIKQIVLCLQNE